MRPDRPTTAAWRVLAALASTLLLLLHVAVPVAAQETHGDAPPGVSDEQLVEDAYRGLLGRAPDDAGREHWLERLRAGEPQREVLAALAGTAEHRRHLVTEAFQDFLDRDPDPGAMDWYTTLLDRSATATTVRADVLGSAEYDGRAGGGDEAWIEAVYQDVLGRQPDADGRRYFLDQLRSGVPRQPIASAILVSPENRTGTPLAIEDVTPPRQSLVQALDTVEIDLDRPVIAEAATIVVTVDGQRVGGTVAQGDFADILVFQFDDSAARAIAPGARATVAATAVAHDGSQVGRSDVGFYYQRPSQSLARGDSGAAVQDLQNDLAQRGYWVGPIDGQYGDLTQQAVYAFQKAHGMERTGTADAATLDRLASAGRVQPRSTSGTWWEIDKARQLLIYAVDGRAVWVWNTSTGTEEPYTYDGERYVADTPPGRWDVYRQVDGVRDGALGRLYRPKYFHTDGIAVHGYPNVPPYRASHGCVRVTNAAMDWIWANGVMPIGVDVWVY